VGKTLSIKPKGNPKSKRKKSSGGGWREYAKLLFAALAIAAVVKTFFLHAYRLPSRSMEDTLLVGDCLLVDKVSFGASLPFFELRLPALTSPARGDVLLFNYPLDPGKGYVKRCVAVAGQVVEIRDKALFVDGQRVPDPPYSKFLDAHIYRRFENPRDNNGPLTVPEGYVFVMGDNRDNSRDSRHWGMLPLELVLGRTLCVYWSCQPRSQIVKAGEVGAGSGALSIINRIRWERVGLWIN
jgi:signal peptidase I